MEFYLLKPVHFLKVGHHGSHNGTPTGEMLDSGVPIRDGDDESDNVDHTNLDFVRVDALEALRAVDRLFN